MGRASAPPDHWAFGARTVGGLPAHGEPGSRHNGSHRCRAGRKQTQILDNGVTKGGLTGVGLKGARSVASSGLTEGLRIWQAAVVRLWSAEDNTSATLILSWLLGREEGPLWAVRLRYGDASEPSWEQEIQVRAANIQQAFQKLLTQARTHNELVKALSGGTALPDQFPADSWLSPDESALLDKLKMLMEAREPVALHIRYRPEMGLSTSWAAVLHDPTQHSAQGVLVTAQGRNLA